MPPHEMTGICSSVLPKRRYFTGGGCAESAALVEAEVMRRSRREQHPELVRHEQNHEQQRARDEAQRRTWNKVPVHGEEIGELDDGL